MVQRPFWWLVLVALTVLAIAVPLARKKKTPTRVSASPAVTASAVTASAVASVPSTPAPGPIAPNVADASVPIAADASSVAVEPTRPPWPADAKYVLHVGDSSLGFERGLALEMGARFKAAGVRYEAVTEIDAGLHTFATSKKLEALLHWKKPDVVLLTLGMNNLTVAKPADYEGDVKSIVAQVGDRPCWWIGPLSIGRPETGLIAMLARTTSPCGWMNSYELEIERQADHLHPTQPGASHWADAIWPVLGAPLREVAP